MFSSLLGLLRPLYRFPTCLLRKALIGFIHFCRQLHFVLIDGLISDGLRSIYLLLLMATQLMTSVHLLEPLLLNLVLPLSRFKFLQLGRLQRPLLRLLRLLFNLL